MSNDNEFRLGDIVSWKGDSWGVEGSFTKLLPVGTLGRVVSLTDLSEIPQELRDLVASLSGGAETLTDDTGLTVRWEGTWGESPVTPREVTKVQPSDAELTALLA